MKGGVILLNLSLTFLLLGAIMAASAQMRTVGVAAGNKFRYVINVSWSATDPTATPSEFLVEANDTQWLETSITTVSGTNITGELTRNYRNGTETTTEGWIDVDTGDGEEIVPFFISANLTAGDAVYNFPSNIPIVNETISRTYLGDARDTNHFYASTSNGETYYSISVYWDKPTGVLVEMQGEMHTSDFSEAYSQEFLIVGSDQWLVPEFSSSPILAFLMMVAALAVVIHGKKT